MDSLDLTRIFDVDHYQTKPGTRGEKGTGLGLYLSKGFIEKNGGKLWVESVIGKGTIFYFNLPAKNRQTARPASSLSEIKIKKLKILIVDDNDSLRMILGEIVKKYSNETLFAANGVEAVSAMKNNPDTDLILMDFFMPEMNGYEATKNIRMFNEKVLIFVETADTLSDVNVEFKGAGITDFFPKPYSKTYFSQLLSRHFGPK
jgi:CheY-like chemotaxis protein